MPAARTFLWMALAATLGACSKGEPPPAPKAQPAAPAPAADPGPAKTGEIDDGLKERLARQEAAARMFESKVLNPPPPPSSIPAAPAPQPAPGGVVAPQPRVEPSRIDPARVEPPKAPKGEPAQAEPAKTQPPPASRTDLAAARPAPTPTPEPAAVTKLVSRVDPEFPREAASSGYEQGNVKARMTLDASGGVTRVEILAANPRRVFDRAVVRALSQWRYNEGAPGRTVDMEIDFRR